MQTSAGPGIQSADCLLFLIMQIAAASSQSRTSLKQYNDQPRSDLSARQIHADRSSAGCSASASNAYEVLGLLLGVPGIGIDDVDTQLTVGVVACTRTYIVAVVFRYEMIMMMIRRRRACAYSHQSR